MHWSHYFLAGTIMLLFAGIEVNSWLLEYHKFTKMIKVNSTHLVNKGLH